MQAVASAITSLETPSACSPTRSARGCALIRELTQAPYDGVAIGGFINGQDPELPPTERTTQWFNRVLKHIHIHAPAAKIILVRTPPDALPAVELATRTCSSQRRFLVLTPAQFVTTHRESR